MKEIPTDYPEEVKSLAEIIAQQEPESAAGFRAFLKFLREEVTVGELLANRLAQANLDVVISTYRHDDDLGNPYPPIDFRRLTGGGGYKYEAFMLKGDGEHLYYFDLGWPQHPYYLNYLRSEDVIPPEAYSYEKYPKHRLGVDQPFTKLLERAPIKGGVLEFYNYNTQRWEKQDGVESKRISSFKLGLALGVLEKDRAKLTRDGEKILRKREEQKEAKRKRWEEEDRRRTFSLELGGEGITFKTLEEEGEPRDFLANYLEALSRSSRFLKIRPNTKAQVENFGVKIKIIPPPNAPEEAREPYYWPVSPFDERVGNLVEEKGENRDEIPAFFLGAFSHLVISNMTLRLVAIPTSHLPKDAAFCVGVKMEGETRFGSRFGSEMVLAKLTNTDERFRPQGFKEGEYIIFAAEDLIDPLSKKEDKPEVVRIVGLSRQEGSLFYKDVDVSRVPVIFLRAVEKPGKRAIKGSGSKRLPVPRKLLPGK